MEKETILIVDDEKEIRDLINIYIRNEGYKTVLAENGMEAIEAAQNKNVDLIILDIMMPGMDGIQTCMKIRQERNMPIIMLTAKSEDIDKIMGLTTGADDYITKPFNPLELVARVKSQLRRYFRFNNFEKTVKNTNIIEVDDLVINIATHEITVNGENVNLTPIEFGILKLLAKNRGIIFSIEKIYELVWNESFMDSENTVMVHIRKIRAKIEQNPRNPIYIKTVWGVGYKIEN